MARETRPTDVMAKATPSLEAVTRQRLTWPSRTDWPRESGHRTNCASRRATRWRSYHPEGVPVNDAVGIVGAIVLRLASVSVNDPRRPRARGVEGDGPVARAS
jgi:hypothetical protein